ncbi:MAG: ferredoxin-thioredoxin reductase catalytic domain-containing protein [Nanobdellota archaeon]
MKYEFDLEQFRKIKGKICPCVALSRKTATEDYICPCKDFMDTGECRCGLFKKAE